MAMEFVARTTILLACLCGSRHVQAGSNFFTATTPASRRSLQREGLEVPLTATPTPPPSPLSPQPEVSKGIYQPDCDDSEASRELLSRMRELQDELEAIHQATQQAADAKQFTEAAEHQARGLELTAERDNLRGALIALCGDPNLLGPAADMEAVVSRTWQRRLDEMTGPLEAAINTTLAIVQQSLRHAAEAGHTHIQIGESNLYTRSYVPDDCTNCYVVNLGFCTVLVGSDLTDAQQREFYDATPGPPPVNSFNEGLAAPPTAQTQNRCSEAEASVLASTYDATTLHSYQDYTRTMYSREARLLLQWRLHAAGYAMSFFTANPPNEWDSQNPLLVVAYGQVRAGWSWMGVDGPRLFERPRATEYYSTGDETSHQVSWSSHNERMSNAHRVLASHPETFVDFVRILADDDIEKFY